MATAAVKLKILTQTTNRKGDKGCVAIGTDNIMYNVYIIQNEMVVSKLQIGAYVLLRFVDITSIDNAISPPTHRIRVSSRSKVFYNY